MRKYWLLLLAVTLFVGCKQSVVTEFIEQISCYSDFSTVDWDEISSKYYRPNAADWDSEMDKQIINGFPVDIAADLWHITRNARTDFHQKSLPLRATASKSVTSALDQTEAMFDTIFVHCVSQEYYMRLFPEVYNQFMTPAIDKLVSELAGN